MHAEKHPKESCITLILALSMKARIQPEFQAFTHQTFGF